ncbi:hypothetical protein F4677DRAFT_37592 [Hypoxylon crocopeplum]|nr:hypothetical protein F4677DRAFT_37592 [Hypoxylon crocopeplum]
MWLINVQNFKLEFVTEPVKGSYAILSHTWGEDEVSFQDLQDLPRARKKNSFAKIERTCQLASERCFDMPGSTLAASTSPVVQSFPKRSTLCSSGT